ncbi:cryptochrome/photolyase family protein [uncultured Endozoicomonas sp.]|uniref:cryptochrome/photolyase family protein n=1 Tax=uncultured Endozoicomonas sp. TaxID=432652 RepID=UPI002629590E|nr:cryptochrome/photolyase family protein [uncultured Endozoicomonas sp.]
MANKKSYNTLRLILGDQLNASHSWFKQKNSDCLYVVAELLQETHYATHHVQKVCGFFLAMEYFATALEQSGHQVLHLTLDETSTFKDLTALIKHLCKEYAIENFEYQRPDEYRLLEQLRTLKPGKHIQIEEQDTEHFLVPFNELAVRFPKGKPGRMETFYRKMRRDHNILINNGEPEGGLWNYDQENRCKLKPEDVASIPTPLTFAHSTMAILKRLKRHKVRTIGSIGRELIWPVNRQESLKLLNHFCKHCLPYFGKFQDAMTDSSEHQWSLYHSRLSFSLNTKMLHPKQVIDKAIATWQKNQKQITIAQLEGFIRQVLGWREYIRGVYWSNMPEYESMNALKAKRPLPDWFWTGNTSMNCMKQAITQSLEYAYAHHIQRLMITGNFCLLAGIDPDQVDQWYLGIYMDAIQWVELPNTRGMSQYADGGMIASKPYAASGNYVKKMSDYCRRCAYSVNEKDTDNACPLNSLYWLFMEKNRQSLQQNPRTALVYKGWDKRSDSDRSAIMKRGKWCLQHLDKL